MAVTARHTKLPQHQTGTDRPGGLEPWGWQDFRFTLAQLSFCSFAQQHHNFRESFAKVLNERHTQTQSVTHIGPTEQAISISRSGPSWQKRRAVFVGMWIGAGNLAVHGYHKRKCIVETPTPKCVYHALLRAHFLRPFSHNSATFFEIFAFLRPTATFGKTFAKVLPTPI